MKKLGINTQDKFVRDRTMKNQPNTQKWDSPAAQEFKRRFPDTWESFSAEQKKHVVFCMNGWAVHCENLPLLASKDSVMYREVKDVLLRERDSGRMTEATYRFLLRNFTPPAAQPASVSESVVELIQSRIKELKEADGKACEKRWNMSLSANERGIWREQSNEITGRRHELEDLLRKLKTHQPTNPPR